MAAQTNLRVQLDAFNIKDPVASVSLTSAPIPEPAEGEVLVRVTLRPVNPADVFSLQGVYPGFRPASMPAVPGLEGTGTVVHNGPGASKFAPGQRVSGAPFDTVEHGSGTWQQYIVAKESSLVAVPDGVSEEAAAQFWVNPVTVVGMLNVLDVPQGEYLLQTAAGSVLGRQMVQLAKSRGIRTINVVRRQELADELKALGADEVVVSVQGEGLVDKVKEITGGRGAYGAIECIGGDIFAQVCGAVRDNGTVLIYGAMSGLTATYAIPDLLFRGVKVSGFWLMPYTNSLPAEERAKLLDGVMQLLKDGVITPYAGNRFSLEQVKEAVAVATSSARGGKALLEG
ncbi:hypothetical protein ABPG77_000733 [Micractinium sp. CCAP 211/92]